MVTKIRFKFKDKKYVLEYTSESIMEMERRGFYANEILKKTFTLLPDMFSGAFIANHPSVPDETIVEIYSKFDNKKELFEALVGMYTGAVNDYANTFTKVENGVQWEKA